MPQTDASRSSRRLSFLFFLLHPGYVRYFVPVLRRLSEQGHEVELAFSRDEKDPGDLALVERLLDEIPGVTAVAAPARPREDGWRAVALLVRSLVDLGRYSHPRYVDAPALRDRVRRRFQTSVEEGPRVPQLARVVLRRMIEVAAAPRSARSADRIVALLARLEDAIPTSPQVDEFIRTHRPDAIVVSPMIDFASTQVEFVKSAQRLGIPSGIAVASWDNLTGKGLLRVLPDRVFVWNETQRDEAATMHAVPRDRVVVTGAPKFDEWFARTPTRSREEFAARVGLPSRPYILWVCSSPFIAPNEVALVHDWLSTLRAASSRLATTPVLVRPHPQNARQWNEVDLGRWGPAVIWPQGGAQPDAGDARADFFDSFAHSEAVVGINTSAMIEAAIVGKPVLTILDPRSRERQDGTLHFRYLLHEHGGFLRVADSLEQHVAQLEDAIESNGREAEAFVARFVRPLGRDVAAADVLTQAIVDLARIQVAPPRRSMGRSAARVALTPLAAAAGLAGRRHYVEARRRSS